MKQILSDVLDLFLIFSLAAGAGLTLAAIGVGLHSCGNPDVPINSAPYVTPPVTPIPTSKHTPKPKHAPTAEEDAAYVDQILKELNT